MSILQNAVNSIIIGLEDLESSEERRLVSAVRNIHAGILLLFKHKLAELSPAGSDEVLIKDTVLPIIGEDGRIFWTGKGKKTVDVRQIQERFNSLGVRVDWNRVEAIQKYRNDIEHYFSRTHPDSVRKLVSDCFIVIRDFVRVNLGMDPRDLLGDDYWNILVSTAEVYQREKEECLESLGTVDWQSQVLLESIKKMICTECDSDLISLENNPVELSDAQLKCRSCGKTWDYEEAVEEALSLYESREKSYRDYKEEYSEPLGNCPSCESNTYIGEENYCPKCGAGGPYICKRCGNEILIEELVIGGDYCSWCEHMMSKDD
jgi:RNase P subunit RPR2